MVSFLEITLDPVCWRIATPFTDTCDVVYLLFQMDYSRSTELE